MSTARSGTPAADMRELIVGELPHLRRYALFLTREPSHAEDLVQDCVARAIDRETQYRYDVDLRSWLFTILRNLFLNEMRRRQRAPFVDRDGDEPLSDHIQGAQEATVELRELCDALARLSHDHAEILVLIVVEGYTYDEAARILDVPVGTVRSRLARARVGLQRELGHGDDADLFQEA